jgi:hypothetical protein
VRDANELVNALERRAPGLLDLLTASTDEELLPALNSLLQRAVERIEANSANFANLDEVGLSAVLASSISQPGIVVSQETHSNGHVDLTIEVGLCSPVRTILGEAKMLRGAAYHIAGVSQLLGRYLTGRESVGLMVIYCAKQDITGKIKDIRLAMDRELPSSQQGPTCDHAMKWWFSSRHKHPSGEEIHLEHIGCNLYTELRLGGTGSRS